MSNRRLLERQLVALDGHVTGHVGTHQNDRVPTSLPHGNESPVLPNLPRTSPLHGTMNLMGSTPPGQNGTPPPTLAVSTILTAVAAAAAYPSPVAWGLLTFAAFEALTYAAIVARYTRLDQLTHQAGWERSRYRIVTTPGFRSFTPANIVLGHINDPIPWSGPVITLHKPERWLTETDGDSILISHVLPNEWVIAPLDGHGRRVYGTSATEPVTNIARHYARTVL